MEEPQQLVAYVADLKFASEIAKDKDDGGISLQVKMTIVLKDMTPQDLETLGYMQRDGGTKLTLLQEQLQLPMSKAGGAKTE
jgi:hypothetical protein